MIDIRVEKFADVIDVIKPLLEMHWQEIANNRDVIPLAPDYERYQAVEAAGLMTIITARAAGELVGYSIFFLMPHPHYRTTLFAMNDILFVSPAYRGGSTGLRLIRASERLMKEKGAKKISWHIKPTHDFSPMLERQGYVQDEIILSKIIGD